MGLQEPELRDLSLLRNVQIGSGDYPTSKMRVMGSFSRRKGVAEGIVRTWSWPITSLYHRHWTFKS